MTRTGSQGLPPYSEVRLGHRQGDAGKKGTDATAEEMPMEEDPPEAPDPTKQKRAKFVCTNFVLGEANSTQTLNQQGYHTKEKVHDALEGYEITAGPLAIHVVGKEAHVSVVMRSMVD